MQLKRAVAIIVTCVALSAATYAAQGPSVPPVVRRGLDAYRSNGGDAAIRAWLVNSPLANDSGAANSVIVLRRLEQVYGSMVGDEVLKVNPIGNHVVRVYVVLLFQKGPVYMWLKCYETASQWLVSAFLFNPRPDPILPSTLLNR